MTLFLPLLPRMRLTPLAILLGGALAAAAPALPAQAFETVASESFDYAPGPLGFVTPPTGGFGWADKWYAGLSGYAAYVTSPGFDTAGNKATTALNNDGSYRKIQSLYLGSLVNANGEIGVDNTSVWVSFLSQRDSSSMDDYGGLSLNLWLVAEQLFLGSPSGGDEWGFERPGSPGVTVPGSSVLALTFLVYKIDFQPGDDRVRLWIDPPTGHPDPNLLPPDLDATVLDFTFNEIRLQSGNGPNLHGWHFDDLRITADAFRPTYSVDNAVAGGAALIRVVNCSPGASVTIGYTQAGGGPTSTPLGPVAMTPPIRQLPPFTANAAGEVSLAFPIPPGLAGATVFTQAAELAPARILSNPLVVQIQ